MEQIQFVGTTPEKLCDLFDGRIEEKINSLKENFQPKRQEYITRQETADFFKVDLATIHNWTKKGTLTAYKIGQRVYYKLDEVEDALTKVKVK